MDTVLIALIVKPKGPARRPDSHIIPGFWELEMDVILVTFRAWKQEENSLNLKQDVAEDKHTRSIKFSLINWGTL